MKKIKKPKTEFTLNDYVKANRKASREIEIEMYGHPITYSKVAESKKNYKRSRDKFRYKLPA